MSFQRETGDTDDGPGYRTRPTASFPERGRSGRRAVGRGVEGDVAERVAGVGAEGGDRRDADHDDQGQHDRVLDRGRAVLAPQEPLEAGEPLLHETLPFLGTEV